MRNFLMLLLVVAVVGICTGPAIGTVNPDPDEIGLYFDLNADTACTTVEPDIPFYAYAIITHPSSQEIWGVEFSLCAEISGGDESQLFLLEETWAVGWNDVGVWEDLCTGRVGGFVSPVPQTGENAVLVRFQFMMTADLSIKFFIGPYALQAIDDGLPAYLGANDEVLPLSVSSGSPDLPVAAVNGECNVVAVETRPFSSVKCLFR